MLWSNENSVSGTEYVIAHSDQGNFEKLRNTVAQHRGTHTESLHNTTADSLSREISIKQRKLFDKISLFYSYGCCFS